MTKTIAPADKTGESVLKGIKKLDASRMDAASFSDLCDTFVDDLDLDPEVSQALAHLFIRQVISSHLTKTQESIYNFNFALRYAIDDGYSLEEVVKELKERHSLSAALQHVNVVYHLVRSDKIKARLLEVISALKVVIADREKKA